MAGSGTAGFADGPAATAQFNEPNGVAIDSAGNIYVAEPQGHRIRYLAPGGVVSTLAGQFPGYYNGVGSSALFFRPREVLIAGNGDVLVADAVNGSIRRIDPRTGAVSTLAGTGRGGYQDGPAVQAQFNTPSGLARDAAGNVYVTDTDNFRVRRISTAGVVSTLAGSGVRGHLDGPAANARFWEPQGIAVDAAGNLYVADRVGQRIRKIDILAGTVSTVAGTGTAGYADGAALSAQFNGPHRLAYDFAHQVLYITEREGSRLRVLDLATGIVSTVLGAAGAGYRDGPVATAQVDRPHGLARTATGELLLADTFNHRIRLVTGVVLASATSRTTATLTAWPSPADQQLTVQLPLPPEPAHLSLLDALGREVARLPVAPQAGTAQLPVTQLPAGFYVLRLLAASGVQSRRIIIRH